MTALGVDEAYRRLFDSLRAAGLDPEDSFHWDPKRPPFPGLNYFDAKDAGIYFGREDEVRQVIETLTRMQRQGEPRLLVVVGSSGSGKSSLVRAGVLPRLGKDRSRWVLVDPFRPGAEPISELARSSFSAFPEDSGRPDWKTIRDRLRDEPRAAKLGEGPAAVATSVLTEYADELTMRLGCREASVLLVVDQVEELLQSVAGDEALAFFNVLRRATERPGGRVFGLLTLRSDFLGSFQNHPALRGLAFADMPLGLLPVENFPQVIEGPADRAEIALEPGLVHSMIADARTDDALPLLAFTLREMYERCRDQEILTLKVYRDDLGGIKGAVARVVDRIKAGGPWTPEVAHALRRAFLKLVRVNDEGQFTRQPYRWADLPDLAAPVLEAFVKARLLSSNGDIVEVTHESLFRVWSELAGWLDEGRELMLWKKTIKDELNDWITHDRPPDRLLSGARVAEARRWLASNADDFPAPESEFLAASITAEDDRIARERVQQEKLRRLARSLAVGVVVASVLALIAIGMGGYALMKRQQANRAAHLAQAQTLVAENATKQAKAQTRIATSRQLAALSVAERDKRFDRSLLLAVAALQVENTSEARNTLYSALEGQPGLTSFLHASEGHVQSVAFSPDGKTIAVGYGSSSGDGVVLWDVAARERLAGQPLAVKEGHIGSVAFSPDGKTIAAGYHVGYIVFDARGKTEKHVGGSGVVLWDTAARKRLVDEPLPVMDGYVSSVAFSPDGKTVAAGITAIRGGGGVVLWDLAARKRLVNTPLAVKEGYVESVAFSPNGKTVAAGYVGNDFFESGGVVLWDLAARKRLVGEPLSVKDGNIISVAFSPDSKTIAAGYYVLNVKHRADGAMSFVPGDIGSSGVALWDVAARKRLVDDPLSVKEGSVKSVVFSPDGKTIAAGYDVSAGGGVALYDVAARRRVGDKPLPMKDLYIVSAAFSPDGKTIAAGYSDVTGGGVVLCDVAAHGRLVNEPLSVKEGGVYRVAFSPDGKTIAAGYSARRGDDSGWSGGVVLWHVAERKRLVNQPLTVKEGSVESVAFSPDGKTIAAGYNNIVFTSTGHDGGVVLWDVAARKRLVDDPLSVKEGSVDSVAFGPGGKTIAAGYSDVVTGAGVVLWDVAARKRLVDESFSWQGTLRGMAFSPDGNTIAAYGYGGGVSLWDVAARARLVPELFFVKEGDVESVAFSPDGNAVAAGYFARAGGAGVVLWDVAARKRLVDEPLFVNEGQVKSVAFSPNCKTIAAGYGVTRGGGVVLWDLDARKRLVDETLFVKEGGVKSVAFSPDGKTVAAGYSFADQSGGVVLWEVDLESWQRQAGQIANRNFTRDEWRQYFPDEPYRSTFPELPVPPEVIPNDATSPSRPAGRAIRPPSLRK